MVDQEEVRGDIELLPCCIILSEIEATRAGKSKLIGRSLDNLEDSTGHFILCFFDHTTIVLNLEHGQVATLFASNEAVMAECTNCEDLAHKCNRTDNGKVLCHVKQEDLVTCSNKQV